MQNKNQIKPWSAIDSNNIVTEPILNAELNNSVYQTLTTWYTAQTDLEQPISTHLVIKI